MLLIFCSICIGSEIKSENTVINNGPDMERVPPLKHALCYTGPPVRPTLSLGVPFQRFGGPGAAGNSRKQKLAMATVESGGREGKQPPEGVHSHWVL